MRASRRIPILFFDAGTDVLRLRHEQSLSDAHTDVTNDLVRRVAEHKEGKPGSCTGRCNVTRLVYFERFDYIRDAIARGSYPRAKPYSVILRVRLCENSET